MQRKHSRYTDQMQPSCMTRFVPWAPRFPFLSFVFTLNFAVSNSQASQVNEKARDSYMAAMDTYYKANQQADYGSFIILCFLPNYDQSRLLSSELKLACWHVFSVLTSALICKNRHPQEVNGAVGSHVHDPSISRHDAVNLAEQTVHIYVSERTYILFSSMTPSFCEGRKEVTKLRKAEQKCQAHIFVFTDMATLCRPTAQDRKSE